MSRIHLSVPSSSVTIQGNKSKRTRKNPNTRSATDNQVKMDYSRNMDYFKNQISTILVKCIKNLPAGDVRYLSCDPILTSEVMLDIALEYDRPGQMNQDLERGVNHPSFFVPTLITTTQVLTLPTLPPCEDMRTLRLLLQGDVTPNIHSIN